MKFFTNTKLRSGFEVGKIYRLTNNVGVNKVQILRQKSSQKGKCDDLGYMPMGRCLMCKIVDSIDTRFISGIRVWVSEDLIRKED